jgi:hypothetical protein
VSREVEEIQNIKYSWLKLFEEAKQVASNLGTDPELRTGSKIRKKKRFFDDTVTQTVVLLLNFQLFVSRYGCSSIPRICFYKI